jgi:hypothetical protein
MDKIQSTLEAIFNSNIFWGVITLVLAALGLSGKFSMKFAELFLVLAWGLGCFGLRRSGLPRDPKLLCGLFLGFAAVLLLLDWWMVRPEMAVSQEAELSFKALATNIGYKEGTKVSGFSWRPQFVDVRFSIDSVSNYPITNLDITAQMTVPNALFVGMDQTSKISGVEFRYPPHTAPSLDWPSTNGDVAHIGEVLPDPLPTWKGGSWYGIHCQRLEGGEKIKIKIVMWNRNTPGTPPHEFHISGSYETTPSEGSRRVLIDKMVAIVK